MNWYLSKIRLSRSPAVRVLEESLRQPDAGKRRSAQHHMLWSAFATDPNQKRDFLWRAESDGSFLTLSPCPPIKQEGGLFEVGEPKRFHPVLQHGDRLEFKLQANATKMRRDIGKRVDVVMDALHSVQPGERAEKRMELAEKAGKAWLARQGEKAGFVFQPGDVCLEDYRVELLPRFNESKKSKPQFGILDFAGQLEVTDPEAFLAQLVKGFGRAKAFGCGLMLIRRAL